MAIIAGLSSVLKGSFSTQGVLGGSIASVASNQTLGKLAIAYGAGKALGGASEAVGSIRRNRGRQK